MSAAKHSMSSPKPLRVAIIATPWLTIPPKGYGGIEMVLDGLVKGLIDNGVQVEIFGVAQRSRYGAKVHSFYKEEQFKYIHDSMYDTALVIPSGHVQNALRAIEEDGGFDIIHDHNNYIGPLVLSWATRLKTIPPAVHTLHGPPFTTAQMLKQGRSDNRPYWDQIDGKHNLYIVPISKAMADHAPKGMHDAMLPAVHNAVDVKAFPFVTVKKKYFITLARFNRDKGQHIAAKYSAKYKYRLRMAGTVGGIETSRKLLLELANPMSKYRQNEEFRYYSDQVLQYTIRNPRITYTGNVSGKKKLKFISEARALLFPIDWEEPFGMAVIEALACGTPVVAMNRGAMPEIIEHGVNGFLADTEEEFGEYMKRVDEIDPAACRKSVEEKFSADMMAKNYIKLYKKVLAKKRID